MCIRDRGTDVTDNKALTGDIGTFILPGVLPGSKAPVFLGGSDLGIAKNSPNQAEALAWVKLYSGSTNQLLQASNEGFIPNASNLVGQVNVSSNIKTYFKAAAVSQFTPPVPGWATVEADDVMQDLLAQVAEGLSLIHILLVHPVVNLDDRATQLSQPIQHGGDALVIERRGEPVHRTLPGVRADRRQFFCQQRPVRSQRLERVRTSLEPTEIGFLPDLRLDQVTAGSARHDARGSRGQACNDDLVTRAIERANTLQRHPLRAQIQSRSWLSAGRQGISRDGTSVA